MKKYDVTAQRTYTTTVTVYANSKAEAKKKFTENPQNHSFYSEELEQCNVTKDTTGNPHISLSKD